MFLCAPHLLTNRYFPLVLAIYCDQREPYLSCYQTLTCVLVFILLSNSKFFKDKISIIINKMVNQTT